MNPEKILFYDIMTDLALECFIKTASMTGGDILSGINSTKIKPIKPLDQPTWMKSIQNQEQRRQKEMERQQKEMEEAAERPYRSPTAELFAQSHGVNPSLLYTDQGAAFDQLVTFLAKNYAKKD